MLEKLQLLLNKKVKITFMSIRHNGTFHIEGTLICITDRAIFANDAISNYPEFYQGFGDSGILIDRIKTVEVAENAEYQ